ncbi:hypothetical protein WH367_20190 [Comamonas sp. MYb21]|uniref:hypothetical protein n=1 Tax=Comamonas sp. MYb21 TaxID=1848648 RepID=UPI0030A3CA42
MDVDMRCIRFLVIALSFILNSPAIACKLGGVQQFIEFEEGSTTIGKSTARNVVLWFLDWRDIDGISSVLIFTHYSVNNKNTEDISAKRLSNISKLIAPLVGEGIEVEYVNSPKEPKSRAAAKYYFNTLGISIQPKCIETQSCCGGNMR